MRSGIPTVLGDALLTVGEVLAFGLVILVFIVVWFSFAVLRVILGIPGALDGALRGSGRRALDPTAS